MRLNFAAGSAITYSGTSTQSAAFATNTVVFLRSTTSCFITVAVNPTATAGAGSLLVGAEEGTILTIPAGQKIAVIHQTNNGILSIVPVLAL